MAVTTTRRGRPYVGTAFTVTATFTDHNGDVADPGDPTFLVVKPNGEHIIYTTDLLTHVSTGVWRLKIPTDVSGQWYVRAYSTLGIEAVQEGFFIVCPAQVVNLPIPAVIVTEVGDPLITEDFFVLITE